MAVAIDDVNRFVALSAVEREAMQTMPLEALDREWENMEQQGHPGKSPDMEPEAKVLGLQFRKGVRIQSTGAKIFKLVQASIDLAAHPQATPDEIAILNGHLQW